MPLNEVREILDTIQAVCAVEPLTIETHDRCPAVFESYRFSLYDSMLVAAELISGASILYSEDLQHGQVIDNQLRVTNPF
jgi:predicted nucleic acid-binding protein